MAHKIQSMASILQKIKYCSQKAGLKNADLSR
jgi:hypothetical protein